MCHLDSGQFEPGVLLVLEEFGSLEAIVVAAFDVVTA
jgi:hypothetical protein